MNAAVRRLAVERTEVRCNASDEISEDIVPRAEQRLEHLVILRRLLR